MGGKTDMNEKGLIHIYCGDGKGKTTAAIGLAIRAVGAGMKVCFAQFMKAGSSSEWEILKKIEGIQAMIAKNTYGFTWKMTKQEKEELTSINNKCLEEILDQMEDYDLLILDEIISAYQNDLVDKRKVLDILERNQHTEVVLTGRNPSDEFMDIADYVTEMKCIRHPYEKGIAARKGIEY